jgi:hypothetical protein
MSRSVPYPGGGRPGGEDASMKHLKSRQVLLLIAAVVAVPSVCYAVAHLSDAKLQFLVGLGAVGTCGYVLGWIRESPFAQKEIERLGETIAQLEKERRTLKELLTKTLVENQSVPDQQLIAVVSKEPAETRRSGFPRWLRSARTVPGVALDPTPPRGGEPEPPAELRSIGG